MYSELNRQQISILTRYQLRVQFQLPHRAYSVVSQVQIYDQRQLKPAGQVLLNLIFDELEQ
jgi:hypothetical protein